VKSAPRARTPSAALCYHTEAARPPRFRICAVGSKAKLGRRSAAFHSAYARARICAVEGNDLRRVSISFGVPA
jgi:hypothetical protein